MCARTFQGLDVVPVGRARRTSLLVADRRHLRGPQKTETPPPAASRRLRLLALLCDSIAALPVPLVDLTSRSIVLRMVLGTRGPNAAAPLVHTTEQISYRHLPLLLSL